MIKYDNVSDLFLAEIAKIPGAYWKEGRGLFASDDLELVLNKLLNKTPTYKRIDRRNVLASGLSDKLFPWQKDATLKLAKGEKSFIFFACGLGKSAVALNAIELIGAQKILIITRSMGKDVYARDLKKILGKEKPVQILMGLGNESKATDYICKRYNKYLTSRYGEWVRGTRRFESGAYITVCPWEILHAHKDNLLRDWDVIVFDEHHMGKGRTAKRVDAGLATSKMSKIKWSLTATPVRDRLRDLWAQWKMIDWYGAGNNWNWCMRYCDMHENRWGGMDSTGTSNLDELQKRLAYLAEIKTRQDVMHLLPGRMLNTIRIDSKGKIDKVDFSLGQRGIEQAVSIAADLNIDEVVERSVEALFGHEKIVLTGNRRLWVPKVYEKINNALPNTIKDKAWIRWTTGEASVGDRQKLAHEYMQQKDTSLLISTSDAISESIDLQDSDRLIVAALPYTPGSLVQLLGRVSRLGQSRPVTVDFLVAEGTIDDQIEDSLINKLDAIDGLGANTEVQMGIGQVNEEEVMEDLDKWLKENQQ